MITEVSDHQTARRDYREDRVRSIHRRLEEGTYDVDERLDAAVDRLIDNLIGENWSEKTGEEAQSDVKSRAMLPVLA